MTKQPKICKLCTWFNTEECPISNRDPDTPICAARKRENGVRRDLYVLKDLISKMLERLEGSKLKVTVEQLEAILTEQDNESD